MRILLIGYGKMGREIESLATAKGHTIVGSITRDNASQLLDYNGDNTDVAIEFTEPSGAAHNISHCLTNHIPVLSGTTGWLDQFDEMVALAKENEGRFFYASNYSIGVNLFFKVNRQLARLMADQEYRVAVEEIHHTQKKDAPSGTAITLAEGIIEEQARYTSWQLDKASGQNIIPIKAIREDQVPGTHTITYSSEVDTIDIRHTAHSRKGFAQGALMIAEWLVSQKPGHYSMDDYLNELK